VVLLVTAALVIMYKLWERYSGAVSKNSKKSWTVEEGVKDNHDRR
jgi:hypothetical protein